MKPTLHGRIAFFTRIFGYFLAITGLLNFTEYQRPIPAAISIVLYLLAIGWSTGQRPRFQLEDDVTIFALSVAATIPIAGIYAIGDVTDSRNLRWFMAGVALLMAVLAVRERVKTAWAGTIIMSVEMLIWGGMEILIGGGIIGAVMLVAAAHGVSVAMAQSKKAAEEFLSLALVVDSEREALSAARAHSRSRIRAILKSSMPLLKLIEQKKGKLTASDSKELLIGEAGIRDQIRAPGFQAKALVEAILRARKKGLEVSLMDDGDMNLLQAGEKSKIIKKLVKSLDSLSNGKVVIRSVRGEAWTVTLLAHSPESEAPDIFLRL